ncbi:MAG TPA: UvrD-helicase domain-containing protein, partial [Flavobacteriaceae bacterium]|nr:UvrD-helicase domain-containing protein [Flavobacteriaceae bacterium]
MKNSTPFTVYNASAGSGKTFAIVKKYLSFLFTAKRNDAYRNILAITFTNKAVEEMKTRIVENLTAFSNGAITKKQTVLLKAIASETGLSETLIQQKSTAVLKSLVHNYAAFEVSTIDAFTNRVLRTFAKDLGLTMNFEVELDEISILKEAVDRVIAKAGENQELTKVLVDFAISKADDDKSWNIAHDLNQIAKLLTNENNLLPLEKINSKTLSDFHDFSEKLKKACRDQKAFAKECGVEFCGLMEKNGLEVSDFNGGYLPKYFIKLQQENFEDKYIAKWQETIAEKNLYSGGILKKFPKKANLIDQLQPQIALLFEQSKKAVMAARFYDEIRKNLTQLSLLNHIGQAVDAIKKERNLLLISDFNKKIGQSVKNQPVPFIYERLGERYRDYFIDEFQDTSQLQWENLIPLIDNALSGQDEFQQSGSLTLVGDAKQAIYRWRGGKAEQFMDLCGGKSPFSVEVFSENLPSNYRSNAEIVHFNNEFFKHVSQYLNFAPHRALFENAHQKPALPTGGYVHISFVEAENKEEKMQAYPEK